MTAPDNKCDHDLVTVRDIDLPEYCWHMRCRKCGAECNDPLELCQHEEGERIQMWSQDGEGYYLWRCVACGWETVDNMP